MDLNEAEIKLKGRTMAAMKKHGKTVYRRAGVLITLIQSEEDLKVKVKSGEDVEVSAE